MLPRMENKQVVAMKLGDWVTPGGRKVAEPGRGGGSGVGGGTPVRPSDRLGPPETLTTPGVGSAAPVSY